MLDWNEEISVETQRSDFTWSSAQFLLQSFSRQSHYLTITSSDHYQIYISSSDPSTEF